MGTTADGPHPGGRSEVVVGADVPDPDGSSSRSRVPPRGWLLRVLHVGTSAADRTEPLARAEDAARNRPSERRPAPRSWRRRDRFDDFYRSHYPPVVRLAISLTGHRTVAEELAQEAFVEAHRRWLRIVTFDRPDLWVRRVVINRAISHRRRAAVERRALERLDGRPEPRPRAVDDHLVDDEVWAAMRTLSARQAQILALVYVEDQPIATVAEILGVGEETVRTHLKRGRAALAAKLGETDGASRPDDAVPRPGARERRP